MNKNKKIFIVLIIALLVIFIQKMDLDLVVKNEFEKKQIKGVAQQADGLKVIFFDVGQGDSIFVETPNNKQILIDGGPDRMVLEKLNQRLDTWDDYIDVVVLTHPHADHVAGLINVLKSYHVGEVWLTGIVYTSAVYQQFLNLIKQKNIPTKIIYACGINNLNKNKETNITQPACSNNIEIEENTRFKILYPLKNLTGTRVDNLNNSSIVMRLDYGKHKVLFMGDAEKPVEKELINHFDTFEFKSNILKVGHQGASDASSQEFLELIKPDIAIISVGADNSYGHPSLRIIRRFERLGSNIFRTDKGGNIELLINMEKIKVF